MGIQARNAWLRFGAIAVACGCAGASYAAWRSVESVSGAVRRLRNDHWTLTIAVRLLVPPARLHTEHAQQSGVCALSELAGVAQAYSRKQR